MMASTMIISCLVKLIMLLAMVCSSPASSSTQENSNILLEMKALLIDPTGSLRSWTQESLSELCRKWNGITCDNTSSLVIHINLSNKNLSGTLSPALGSLSSLQLLNMSNNMLTGAIPAEIVGCASLRVLDLSYNNLTGELPIGLSHLTQLETLSLWTNSFIGPIPQDIVLCSKLKYLDLGGSHLEGEIPHAIGNLSNLAYLTLAGNQLTGEIPSSLKDLSKLEWIYFGYNQLSGSIPSELGQITSLTHLDLVQNSLSGDFPHSLTNLTSLQYLFLYDNQLTGVIPPSIANLSKLFSLDLSINMMNGNIPSGISNLKQLQILNLFTNRFTGEIPYTIADMQSLQVLALWMNNLTGEVPAKLGLQNNLTVLDLSSNKLWGPIPENLCASKTLHNLILFRNTMSGPIPQSLANCHSLKRVRLEDNLFTGGFPQSLANLPLVYYLDLSSNNFSGRLDTFTWNMPSLQVLQLQKNHFNGSIPPSIQNSKVLVTLDLSQNTFAGDIPLELGSLSQLNKLFLNDNMLSGVIQNGSFLLCKQLTDLNLSNNQLSGSIPSELSTMSMLCTLDLSHNLLSGTIPPQLGDMDSLVYVNLSFNHLSGTVPLSGVFTQSSIEGNPGLCGGSSLRPCISSRGEHGVAHGSVWARVAVVLFLIGLMLAVLGIGNIIWNMKSTDMKGKRVMKLKFMKSKACGEWTLQLFQSVNISVEEVLEAMQEENIVEKSPCVFYKGSTKGGVQFAASEMIISHDKNEKSELGAVLAAIGRSRHPNITNVYGICCGTASSILVFELVEARRLSSLLQHDAGVAFTLERRICVAADMAKAVMHLHRSCSPPVVHGSICSNNVIVDPGFAAHLLPPNTSSACLVSISDVDECAAAEEGSLFAGDIRALGEILLELVVLATNMEACRAPGDVESCRAVVQAELRQLHILADRSQTHEGKEAGSLMWAETVAAQPAVESFRAATQTPSQPVVMCEQMGCMQQLHSATVESSDGGQKMVRGVITCNSVTGVRTAPAGARRGVITGAESAMGTEVAQLARELCREPTQAKLGQVLRVLEGWRRRQSGSGALSSELTGACRSVLVK